MSTSAGVTQPVRHSQWRVYLEAMRVYQWPKNLAVFPGVIFSFNLFDPRVVVSALGAFASFCLASSSMYVFNDIVDAPLDALHPTKKARPVASGRLRRGEASLFALSLIIVALAIAWLSGTTVALLVVVFASVNLAYSFALKHIVILDSMILASGFVFRLLAGVAVSRVTPSSWLLLTAFFLSLLLAFGKRRQELTPIAENGRPTRPVLAHYSSAMLDQMMTLMTGLVIIVYSLFAISEYAIHRFGSPYLVYTVPLVVYGLLRYLYLVHQKEMGEDPAELFLRDRPLKVCVLIWTVAIVVIVYGA